MHLCNLRLLLYKPDLSYAADRGVDGRVIVVCFRDCEVQRLTVTSTWLSYTWRNFRSEQLHQEILFSGKWLAGQDSSYAFSTRTPSRLITYKNRSMTFQWQIEVKAQFVKAQPISVKYAFKLKHKNQLDVGRYVLVDTHGDDIPLSRITLIPLSILPFFFAAVFGVGTFTEVQRVLPILLFAGFFSSALVMVAIGVRQAVLNSHGFLEDQSPPEGKAKLVWDVLRLFVTFSGGARSSNSSSSTGFKGGGGLSGGGGASGSW